MGARVAAVRAAKHGVADSEIVLPLVLALLTTCVVVCVLVLLLKDYEMRRQGRLLNELDNWKCKKPRATAC